jgi:hypothetical protein
MAAALPALVLARHGGKTQTRVKTWTWCAASLFVIAATPSPSPALESLLAAPPPGYVEDTESTGTPIGRFDAGAYAQYLGYDDPNATLMLLVQDGFVGGYGKSWTDQATGHGLAEIVVAFGGGAGARRWLATTASEARRNQYYRGDVAVAGIDPYAGVRYVDPQTTSQADVVMFVKGNDYFLVGFLSDGPDLSGAAAAQSKAQYDFAAAESIARSKWPENVHPFSLPPLAPLVAGWVAVLVLVAGFVVWRLRARAPAAQTYAWDGKIWRSGDGKLWWDGDSWRPAPPPPDSSMDG